MKNIYIFPFSEVGQYKSKRACTEDETCNLTGRQHDLLGKPNGLKVIVSIVLPGKWYLMLPGTNMM